MDKRKKVGVVGFSCLVYLVGSSCLVPFFDGYVRPVYRTVAGNVLDIILCWWLVMAFFSNLSLFAKNHVRFFGIVATVLFLTNSIWAIFFTEVTVEGYMPEIYSALGALSLIGAGITSAYSGFFAKE